MIVSLSCHRIHRKGSELADKIIAHFDPYHPDTHFNKKRFEDFFGFAPTPDVKDLYCYADEMGIDHKYQFSFRCDTATKSKIIHHLQLVRQAQPDNYSSGIWHPYPWWDSSGISALAPYKRKGDHETYHYLWYDTSAGKAYYFEFDL